MYYFLVCSTSFIAVMCNVQNSQLSRFMILFFDFYLSVHLATRFHWKTENFPPELSIVPAKGYICPGMEVPFEVTFAPVELSNDTRYENLSCYVDGSYSPITLTMTGSCIVASTSKEV